MQFEWFSDLPERSNESRHAEYNVRSGCEGDNNAIPSHCSRCMWDKNWSFQQEIDYSDVAVIAIKRCDLGTNLIFPDGLISNA